MKKFIRENSLSVAMFSLFFLTLIGLIIAGYYNQNEELSSHHQPKQNLTQFLGSGTFVEAVFENWESEFLQMGGLVLLTVWLVQKGAVESKSPYKKMAVDASARYSVIHTTWQNKGKAIKESLYSNSLSIALFSLFIFSFLLHAVGGTYASNAEARWHGGEQLSVMGYMASSRFWFESFQNWQSEFLSIGTLLVLSIFLRQRHSVESKPVRAPNSKTGG